jgi:hypothetical protein
MDILSKFNLGPDGKGEIKTIAGFKYGNGIKVSKEGFCGYISAFENVFIDRYCNTQNIYSKTQDHPKGVCIAQYIRDTDSYNIFSSLKKEQ